MKIILLQILNYAVQSLEKFRHKLLTIKSSDANDNYFQLSPINDSDNSAQYIDAMEWALYNRKERDIKNIALTGPYGAGKSSILKTFQKQSKNKDLFFLNISLATFKEESVDNFENVPIVEGAETVPNDIIRKIEISILQQIFYHEEDSKIPDSRFKKIKVSSKRDLAIKSFATLVALLSVFWLLFAKIDINKFPSLVASIIFFQKISLISIISFLSYLSIIFLKKDKRKLKIFFPISLVILNIIVLLIFGFKNTFDLQTSISEFTVFKEITLLLNNFSIVYLLFFMYFFIKEFIGFLNKISINKLKIQNAEIEIGATHQKSIMNQHLDEILYFFSVRPYNVVIIEDLDRFKQTEIFTKLREINLLLNQSEKTKDKNIVFIYAVRDEMFQDKDRTKFFDFIIPVIPTINSSNSSQILLSKNIKNNYNLSEGFIENISFIIDDMRLLHNICNEFYLYKSLLSEQLNAEKLFSIITYKNILPNDFVLLSNNDGLIFTLLNSKKDFITKINLEIDKKISEINLELVTLQSNYFNNVKDLRKIYILELIEKLDNFKSFVINDEDITFDNLTKSENFAHLIDDKASYKEIFIKNYTLSERQQDITILFSDLENEVNPKKNYKKIEKEINGIHADKISLNKKRIRDLEFEKLNNRNRRLAELLQNHKLSLNNEDGINDVNPFLLVLLRNGYIAEDYIDYISIFHEGSITRSDYAFYINVQNRVVQECDYKLNNVNNLIDKLSLEDFKTEYAFNYNLLDFLLSNKNLYINKLQNVISKITDESTISISYVISCFKNIENIKEFTDSLTSQWENFWTVISNDRAIESNLLDEIFLNTIMFSNIESLKMISKNNNYKQNIYCNPLFLNVFSDQNRIKEIISELHIEFEAIDLENSPKELNDFVYENNSYEINIPNLQNFIQFYGEFDQVDFETSNYKAIKESNCKELIEYIDDNFNDYLSDVYFILPKNNKEELDCYMELLNKDIDEKVSELIIRKVNTKVVSIAELNNESIKLQLINNNKIKESWDNVLYLMKDEKNKSSVINFLNKIENAEILSKRKVSNEKDEKNKYIHSDIFKILIQNEGIKNESYELITKCSPWRFDSVDFANLSSEKIEILINNIVVNPNKKSFDNIRKDYKDILVKLVEKQTSSILKIVDTLEIDSIDLENILKSEMLSDIIKNKFVKLLTDDEIITNNGSILILAEIKAANNSFDISTEFLTIILLSKDVNYKTKIKIFNHNSALLDLYKIDEFLINLPSKYGQISNKDKKALIEYSQDNLDFLKILEGIGYISSYKKEKYGLRVFHKRK